MQPQVQQLRTLRRAVLPVMALLMAGAPGLGFGVRTAYVAWAAGAWVHGGEALGAWGLSFVGGWGVGVWMYMQ